MKDSQPSPPALHCPSCDYNLTGLPENRCPECGNQFDPREIAYSASLAPKVMSLIEIAWRLLWLPACWIVLGLCFALAVRELPAMQTAGSFGAAIVLAACTFATFSLAMFNAFSMTPRVAATVFRLRRGKQYVRRRKILESPIAFALLAIHFGLGYLGVRIAFLLFNL